MSWLIILSNLSTFIIQFQRSCIHKVSKKDGRTEIITMPLCHKASEDRDHYYAPPSQSVRGQKSLLWPSVAKHQRSLLWPSVAKRQEIITMPLRHKASEDRDHYYDPPSQSVQRQSTKDRDKHCGNVIHNRTKLFIETDTFCQCFRGQIIKDRDKQWECNT